jgi:hypothetical protein
VLPSLACNPHAAFLDLIERTDPCRTARHSRFRDADAACQRDASSLEARNTWLADKASRFIRTGMVLETVSKYNSDLVPHSTVVNAVPEGSVSFKDSTQATKQPGCIQVLF